MASVPCSFVTGSLGLAKVCPLSLKRFLSNFNVVAIQNSLDGFCNTLNVRNNSKTAGSLSSRVLLVVSYGERFLYGHLPLN